ncbi:hypothetical protein [Ahrensia marina]|uniref:Uncharacterized protein n=1 Tax=Ahrensia marina TaxID=1514904 RepID=A0A0N0E785_9HYPH|nr:hypothetical protein [Ahrensia marina]KPB00888.1 hypothetical protein SU32_10705 [Ahrensia marina]
MDWQAAININRQALLRIVAALVALVQIGNAVPHVVRHQILRVLDPAESAARRLIVLAARVQKSAEIVSAASANPNLPDFAAFNRTIQTPRFKLFDPRKRFDWLDDQPAKQMPKAMPRISVIGVSDPVFETPKELNQDNTALTRRLQALQDALSDLPREAKRLSRQMQKRKTAPAGPKRVPPLRPGLPPGFRQKPDHTVDCVLKECHALVLQHMALTDTS